jgi:dTDP-4-dehydrorhamnose 3,5-epimerase
MIEGVIKKKINSHNDQRGFFREIMKNDNKYTKIKFIQISHSKIKKLIRKGWLVHKKQYQWNYLIKGSIKVSLLDLRKKSKTYMKKMSFSVNEKSPMIYFFPPHIAHGYVTLKNENHMIYGTSGTYSKDEEYKLPFKNE